MTTQDSHFSVYLGEIKNRRYFLVKQILDFLTASTLLILIFPLVVVMGCVIRCVSSGPIIHGQQRIGLQGRLFTCYQFHIDHLPTRLRQFLMRSSLHHLPAFWNVLKGDLSIIGPEPRLQENEVSGFYREGHIKRLSIRPGLHGTWRIPRYHPFGYSPIINQFLDEEYVDKVSFVTDLKIVFQTLLDFTRKTSFQASNPKARSGAYANRSLPLKKIKMATKDLTLFLPIDPFHKETLSSIENLIFEKKIKTVLMIGSWLGEIVQAVASKLPEDGVVYDVNMWIGVLPEKLGEQDANLPVLQEMLLLNMDQINEACLTRKIVSLTMTLDEASSALNISPDLIFFDNRRGLTDLIARESLIAKTRGIVSGNGWLNLEQQKFVFDYAVKQQKAVHTENDFWWIE